MKRSLTIVSACALAIAGIAAGIAVTGLSANTGPPNQGDPDKILTVVSGYQCSGDLAFLPKVEGGGLGPTITVTATTPIVKVTVKSGEKATLVSASFAADFLSGTITISQDVSNYVVWTCAGGGTTTGTTTGTTETTTTTTTTETTTTTTTETTPTTTTTTETTPTTTTATETTPTTTETTPTTTETTATTTETTPTTTAEQPGGVAGVATPPQPTVGVAGVTTPERPGRTPTPPATTGTYGVLGVATPELAYTP